MRYAKALKLITLIALLAGQISLASPQVSAQSRGFTVTPLVKRGDRSPDGERFFTDDVQLGRLSGLHALNNMGDAVFDTYFSGACASGYYLVSKGKTSKIPDSLCTASSSRFAGSLLGANINDNTQIPINLFQSGEGFPYALLLYSGGMLQKIVGTGDVTPMGTVFTAGGSPQFSAGFFDGPAINSTGRVLHTKRISDATNQQQRRDCFSCIGPKRVG